MIIRGFLTVSAIFIVFAPQVHLSPLLLNPSDTQRSPGSNADEGQVLNQHLVQLRESDKNLLRAVALFIGVLVVFSMIICLCATYWCICWALQCPGISILRTIARVSRTCGSRLRSRSRFNKDKRSKESSGDLPPSYEVILATCHGSLECNGTHEDEEDPPSYTEALCKK